MKYKARGDSSPQGKPKVYFTGHSKDCKVYFESISDMILKLHNCAVFYDENPEKPDDGENFINDLDQMQMIVIPVTGRYVYHDTFAHEVVFKHAMERHIPVLPILEEAGLESDFNNKCGDIQYLFPDSGDTTEIRFEDKLKKFLDSVLVTDELAAKVRAAFDAYAFLSYRKKDRRYAQELMRLIHSNDFCRDIAIWYDEFLVPGENFNDAIYKAMEKSELFAMVVTPSLLESPNYVMSTEYPAAKDAGKKILPTIFTPTDNDMLKKCYYDIPEPIDANNREVLAAALAKTLENVSIPGNNSDSQHLVFIGLAYLGGIDVEVDYERAVKLITQAAEQELPEAIEKLVNMYRAGEGVGCSYEAAIEWQRRLVGTCRRKYEKEPSERWGINWINALWNLGGFVFEMGHIMEAGAIYKEMLEHSRKIDSIYNTGRIKRYVGISYDNLGRMCHSQGNFSGAREYYEKMIEIFKSLEEEIDAIRFRRDLSTCYERLGSICKKEGHLSEARKYYEKTYEMNKRLAEETGMTETWRDLSISYNNLGNICLQEGDLSGAKGYYEKGHEISKRLAEEMGTIEARRRLSISYGILGDICRERGDLSGVRGYYEKCHEISKCLAEETGTIEARSNLSVSYNNLGYICQREGDLSGARGYYEKGCEINKHLAEETDTMEVRRGLSSSYGILGDICLQEGDLSGAKGYYKKVYEISKSLAEETKTIGARRDLSNCYGGLGDIYWQEGDLSGAREYYEEGHEIRKRLAEETGTVEARRHLSISYERLGDVCRQEGDLPRAREYYEKCHGIRKCLAEKAETIKERMGLSISYNKLGYICEREGDLPGARGYYEKGCEIRKRLAEETGTIETRRDLSFSYDKLGNICRQEGDLLRARGYYEKEHEIRKRLAEQSKALKAYDDLAIAYMRLSSVAGTDYEKKNYLQQSEIIWMQLAKENPNILRYTEDLKWVREQLDEIPQ